MNSVMINIPKISVLLPVYNCEMYINESVDSILTQTYSDFELIIIDDKSTDNTVKLIKEYKDNRIILIEKEQNTGYTNSLNYGISIAKAEYIARMDADDVSLPNRFKEQINILENHPEIIVCGTNGKLLGTQIDLTMPEKHKDIFLNLFTSKTMLHPTVMIRKDILENNLYNPLKEPSEDYDLWTRLIYRGKFYNIQKNLLYYRKHDQNTSALNVLKQSNSLNESKIDFFEKIGLNFNLYPDNLVKKYVILDQKINPEDFIKLLFFLKQLKKKDYGKEKIINHLLNHILIKNIKQNNFKNNVKYLKKLDFSQILTFINFYFQKKVKN